MPTDLTSSAREPTHQDPDLVRRLLRARDRMVEAPTEAWPVRRLAKVSGVSQAHFARSFKRVFGAPPHRYLLSLRLERAKALLRDTSMPITEVAVAAGWKSLGSFGRTFRDVVGVSPSTHRASGQHAAEDWGAVVPACIQRAAQRPDLTIAVSEKRRRDTGG